MTPVSMPRRTIQRQPVERGVKWADWYCALPRERCADMPAWQELHAERERQERASRDAAQQRQKKTKKTGRKGAGE